MKSGDAMRLSGRATDSRSGPVLIMLVASALLASCGGGGGTGGPPPPPPVSGFGNNIPPTSGPGDVEVFFPTTLGSSWNYYATVTNPLVGAPATFMDSVTVTGTQSVNGQIAAVFQESNPFGSSLPAAGYYLKNAGGLAYLGTSDVTDTVTPKVVPYILALFPVVPGTVAKFDKMGLDYGVDLDGDGINETFNVSVMNTIDGFQPLALGIGAFSRTVKATEGISGTLILSKTKTNVPFSASKSRWSAPGIGVLKTSQTTTAQADTTMVTSTEDMEARGYVVSDGVTTVAHGFGLPFIAAGNLPVNVLPVSDPPALATDGQNFFAASEGASGFVGVLFDAKGAPINSVSLSAGAGSVFPVAAFDGSNYWVIYSPYSGGTSGSVNTIFAQRISPTGALVDATGINLVTVSGTYSSITSTDFAFGNANGLVVFSAFNLATNQHELHGVLVNPNGTVFGAGAFAIATDNSTHLNPAVSFDGTNFFVAWTQLPTSGATVGNIYGVRVSATGSVLDSTPIAISTAPNGQSSPSVAFDGTNHFVVWLDLRNQTTAGTYVPDIYGARVTPGGFLLDGPSASGGFSVNGAGTLTRYSPHVVFTGTEYLVTWTVLGYANSGSPGVQAARVSTSGTLPSGPNMAVMVSGSPTATNSSQFTYSVAAAGPQRAAVIWFDNQNTSTILHGASFSPF